MIDVQIQSRIDVCQGHMFKAIIMRILKYSSEQFLEPHVPYFGVDKILSEINLLIELADEGDKLTSKYKYVREYKCNK